MRRVVIPFLMTAIFLNFTSNHSYGVSYDLSSYHDYDKEAYWAQPAAWAFEQGVMRGYPEEQLLKPYDKLTEAQYLTILLRYLAPKELESTPQLSTHWASKQYEIAKKYHLSVKGIEAANKGIRRGHTALLLAQAVTGKNMTEKQAVQWMYDQKLSTGYPSTEGIYPKTYDSFHPDALLTRAQGAALLHRFHTSSLPKTLKVVEQPIFQQVRDFSVNGIVIGDGQSQVEAHYGVPKRKGVNEYGITWHTYHQNYTQFFMVGYANGKVASLYTNQDVANLGKGLKIGSAKTAVRQAWGAPLETIQKGVTGYVVADEEYDTYLIHDVYVTFFYDLHNNQKVTAVQLMEKSIEERKQGFYGKGSDSLRQSFEGQLFDLVNATRVKNGLSVLKWHDPISNTARKHSVDMAKNDYFSHQNLQGLSPFQRMDRDGISYSMAGENIAMGQFSSIFAHEALMNSIGHRKNVLQPKWTHLGVGVAFNGNSVPYYAQNFFTP